MPYRMLVLNPDFSGYGSGIIGGLKAKGVCAELLTLSINGLLPYVRDKLSPGFGIKRYKSNYFERFQKQIIAEFCKTAYDADLCVFDEVIITPETLTWLKLNIRKE